MDNLEVSSSTLSPNLNETTLRSIIETTAEAFIFSSTPIFNDSATTNGTTPDTWGNVVNFPGHIFHENIFAVISCLFYGTAFILGAIGNGLIIYIVSHYSRMRSLCNVFLASLATADFLLVCLCIPVKLVQLMTYTWTLGEATCKMLHYVQNVSAFCSVLTLTTMSVERYYAILHPVECRTTFSMHHIQKIIVVIWVLALLMSLPAFFVYIHLPVGDPKYYSQQYYYCVKISAEQARHIGRLNGNLLNDHSDLHELQNSHLVDEWNYWRKAYELYMLIAILVLPSIIMTFTYWRICTHLWSIVSRRTAIRYGHTCQVMTTIEPKKPKVSKIPTKVAITSTVIGPNGTIVTNLTTKSASSASSASSSSTVSSTVSSTSSTAQLHQDCKRSMEEDNQTVKQVIKMLVAVVVLFIICWAPVLVVNVLRAFEAIADMNEDWLKELAGVAYLLAYLNSVLNPLIYGFMSKNFRLYFKQIFTTLCLRLLGPRLSPSTFGSTKSDQSKQAVRVVAGKAPGFLVQMDQLEKNGKKKMVPVQAAQARKPSEPKTEEDFSVNDTWPQVTVQGQ